MLTEKDRKWLEERVENLEIFGGYFCPDCPEFVLEDEGFMYCGRGGWENCTVDNPHKYIFKDAAEFEARVAAKLAQYFCFVCSDRPHKGCPARHITTYGREHVEACRLKHARLAVEAEMEAEDK